MIGNEKLKTVLERKLGLLRDYRYHKQYFSAALDYHEYICTSEALEPILSELIEDGKIAPAYLQQIFNDFVLIQSLKKGQKTTTLILQFPNFYTKKIEEEHKLLKNFFDLIQADYEDYKKHQGQVLFNPDAPVIKSDRDDEFFYTQKLHNDIIEKLESPNEQSSNSLDFNESTSTLHFMGTPILISKRVQSDALYLLKTLFKDRARVWNNDEVLDDWKIDVDAKAPKNKVYQAGKAVNRIISQKIQVYDFLEVTTKTVSINKRYLAE